MEVLLILVFVVGYLLIATEHWVRINKSATALVTGVLCWVILNLSHTGSIENHLVETIYESASILFFLLGAMTIVELIDAHGGFEVITDRLQFSKVSYLIWAIGFITFFLSSVLDNLTTTIVMVTLIKKIFKANEARMMLAGIIIIAANAGGAWSPIGDVTTTMLWIGGQISTVHLMKVLFIPSLICLIVPLLLTYNNLSKKLELQTTLNQNQSQQNNNFDKKLIFTLGISSLVLVPVFKTLTHLPPFLGILLFLGIMWAITEILHLKKDEDSKQRLSVMNALSRIDTSSILFFLGILTAVGALSTSGVLKNAASWLAVHLGNIDVLVVSIGLLSAIIDNVPLVAACMGMYDLNTYPPDHHFWKFLAYCAGTGGSILIIGSAAGVAAMGLEKIPFFWYAKKVAWVAALGYFAGALAYILLS